MVQPPKTYLNATRHAVVDIHSTTRRWGWGVAVHVDTADGTQVDYLSSFGTKAEAVAAGQAWLNEKVAQYDAAHTDRTA